MLPVVLIHNLLVRLAIDMACNVAGVERELAQLTIELVRIVVGLLHDVGVERGTVAGRSDLTGLIDVAALSGARLLLVVHGIPVVLVLLVVLAVDVALERNTVGDLLFAPSAHEMIALALETVLAFAKLDPLLLIARASTAFISWRRPIFEPLLMVVRLDVLLDRAFIGQRLLADLAPVLLVVT